VRHRGIVVEIAPKNKVIIMTPSGEFLKVPLRKHVQVGQEIRYTPRRERLSVWQLAAAAVLFLALVGSWPMISERLVPPQPAVPPSPSLLMWIPVLSCWSAPTAKLWVWKG